MSLVAGTRLGPYEIQSAIGAGGMGEVYKARDTRLDRTVAIKILPTELSSDDERRTRFEREAKTIAGLNHPHICTLYDVGEHDGATFLVMELLDGEPLRARLGDTRAAVPAIVDTAIQLADALECAHAKGIVHRDIKPENIFLTARGTAKLLDFGIAKLIAEQAVATEALTVARAGTGPLALGTLAYMSPEQARGEPLDVRTDLFSLGVVLYEMATGTPPFRGTTAGALLGEILTKAPTAPVHLNPDVPADLERLVNKLLEKDRELRYQSARDLRVDLERLRRTLSGPAPVAVAPPAPASIVVLPFENLSPDPDNAFFADGLTEEVIADLSKVRSLCVISRTSAMHYRGTTKPLPAIAHELNVRHVLEGSVRRAGNNLRITAQLIDAATDAHLWSEKYSGTLDDVFDLQEQLSRRIVDALKGALTPEEDRRLAARPFEDVRALDCYLRAMQHVRTFTEANLDRALQLIDNARSMVGERALLCAALALIHWQYHNAGIRLDEETLRAADASADRAVELDAELSAGFLAKGLVAYTRGRMADAARHFAHAGRLDANSDALTFLSYVCALADRPDLARAYADQAIDVDPLNPWALWGRGMCEFVCGDLPAAVDRFRTGIALAPEDPLLMFFMTAAHVYSGRNGEALALIGQIAERWPSYTPWASMYAGALRGDREAVCAAVADLEAYAARDKEMSWQCASCLAAVGERDEALQWLANAIKLGFVNHRFLATRDTFLAPLRGDPRFEGLMDQAREKQRAFEV